MAHFEEPVYWLDHSKHQWPHGPGAEIEHRVIKDMIDGENLAFEALLKQIANNQKTGFLQEITKDGRSQQYGFNLTNNNHWHDLIRLVQFVIQSKGEMPPKSYFRPLVFNWIHGRRQSLSPRFGRRKIIDCLLENIKTPQTKSSSMEQRKNPDLNLIMYGPPGTGKTYHTVNKAIEIVNPDFDLSQDRASIKKEFDRLMNDELITFTTFHQSMSYEDFVEGIKPLKPKVGDQYLKYEIEPGVFKRIYEKAYSNFENAKHPNKRKLSFEDAFEKLNEEWDENTEMKFPLKTKGYDYTIIGFSSTSIQFRKASGGTGHTLSINTLKELYYESRPFDFKQGVGIYYPSLLDKLKSYSPEEGKEISLNNYVLIIDEINRGNVSQIFGELITLIEEDKRLGNKEALTLTLPYSKESFSVPPNLYIIGTMNTADRSVEALDTALRRRFSFLEMPPEPEIISQHGNLKESSGKLNVENYEVDLVKILKVINERIEILLDRDHLIGHSYFMQVDSLTSLKEAFAKNIIPLLQEYFYGDYGKIALVLGEGFCKGKKVAQGKFAKTTDGYDAEAFSEKIIYKIPDVMGKEFAIVEAIKLLLNGSVPETTKDV